MTQRPLDAIEIEGFKSIANMRLNVRPLTVLIGANGSGKSNLIAALGLVNQIVERRLQAYGGRKRASRLLHNGPTHSERIRLQLSFTPNTYEAILTQTDDDNLVFEHERGWFHGQGYALPLLDLDESGHRETALVDEFGIPASRIARHICAAMRSWRVYHFHDTSDRARVKQTQPIGDNESLRPDGANLAAFLYMLREQQAPSYQRIVATIRLAAPFFDDFRLRPDPLSPDTIRLEWSHRDSDAYFDAHALSDGTLRFMCIATLLQQPVPLRPSLVIIDEPELGLHPYAVQQLAALLESASGSTQILVATQSVTLVNHLQPEHIVVVDRRDGASTFARLSAEQLATWTDDYSLGELWEKNVLGGRPQRA